MSYIFHDSYKEDKHLQHGQVSTLEDLLHEPTPDEITYGVDRLPWLAEQIKYYVDTYKPAYIRLLPNCLQGSLIEERCKLLQKVADEINPDVLFVQYKPGVQSPTCNLGWLHPVLSENGYVFPCDSCTLNAEAGHKFHNKWAMCHWTEIEEFYKRPLQSLVPNNICPGCVFSKSNAILQAVIDGMPTPMPETKPLHVNFV